MATGAQQLEQQTTTRAEEPQSSPIDGKALALFCMGSIILVILAGIGTSALASPWEQTPDQHGAGHREVMLVDFAKAAMDPNFIVWGQTNDPVMGGLSTGTFSMDWDCGLGVFEGFVAVVPSLNAPGFITAAVKTDFPDITGCEAIAITARSDNNYTGFRFSVGHAHVPWGKFFAYGYKADFHPAVGAQVTVEIPLTNFTDYWDDATGDAIETCRDNKMYCINAKTMKNLKTMAIWAEGVEGNVHLDMKDIKATQCYN